METDVLISADFEKTSVVIRNCWIIFCQCWIAEQEDQEIILL